MKQSDWDESVILDAAHLPGFTGGDTDLERQVLDVFRASAPEYLAALGDVAQENWKSAAHKLKGAARGIGAWSLARAAERAEHSVAAAGDKVFRETVLAELHQRLHILNGAIAARIKAIDDAEMIDHE